MSDISFNCPQCGAEIAADSQFAGDTAQCPSCNSILLVPMPGITEGMNLGDFKILKRLGLGGMGEVWLAEQEAMKRQVALKILAPHLTKDKDFVNRFLQEVQLAGKLTHPNIVTAFHAGEDQGIYYLAMEFIDGCELENLLAIDKVVDEEKALKVIRDIAIALDYAWSKFQILHRDIKPSNIMLSSDGEGLLMDMGISKSLTEDNSLTMAGEIMGTPYYMSPEQAQSDSNLDFRSDLYSLGATLYHVVTGSTPYYADTAVGILTQHITTPLTPPTKVNPNLSDQCSELIKIMMKKNPEDRQTSWKALIDDIDLVLDKKYPKGVNRSLMTSTLQALDKACLSSEAKPINKVALIGSLVLVITSLIALTLVLKPKQDVDSPIKDLDEASPKVVQTAKQPDQVIPKGVVPQVKVSDPKQPRDYTTTDAKKLWAKAVDFDDSNIGEFDLVITNYQKVARELTGTEFEEKAKNKIKSLYAAKESGVNRVMNRLEKDTQRFVNRGDFRSAANHYENYSGEFAKETESRRYKKALYLSKMKTSGQYSPVTKPRTTAKRDSSSMDSKVMLDICNELIKSEYDKAFKLFKDSDSSSLPKNVEKVLKELSSLDEMVIDKLEKNYKSKKKFQLTISKKRFICAIIDFDRANKRMRLKLTVKNGSINKKVSFSAITQTDKRFLLKGIISKETYAILYGNYILSIKKEAERALKEYKKASHFYPFFKKALFPKSDAEVVFIKILESLDLDMESAKMISNDFLKSDLDLHLVFNTTKKMKAWQSEFKQTFFFRENKDTAKKLYDALWAYSIIEENQEISMLHKMVELSITQIIDVKALFAENLSDWERGTRLRRILTEEQLQEFHRNMPMNKEERQQQRRRAPFKRRF